MSDIDVRRLDDQTFEVRVAGRIPTTHVVTVPPGYAQRLGAAGGVPEVLVRRSFEFLLQREPNTSILARFELGVIARYFPEYERTMRAMLAA